MFLLVSISVSGTDGGKVCFFSGFSAALGLNIFYSFSSIQ